MTVVRALYDRFRQIIHEFAKFGVIGVFGLLITNLGYALFHSKFGMGPVTSATIATIIATCVTYVGNRYWSFKHRQRTSVAREGSIFFVLNGVGLLIQDAVVAFNYYILGHLIHGLSGNKVAEFLALNVGIGLATLFRFWSYRKFVWAEKTGDGGTTVAEGGTPPPDKPLPTGGDVRYAKINPVPGGINHANGHDDHDDVAKRAAENGSYSRR